MTISSLEKQLIEAGLDQQDCKAWFELGTTLLEQKKYDEAMVAFQKTIDINPQIACVWYKMGNSLYYLNKYEEALAAYQKAIDLDQQYANAWCNLGNAFNALNQYEKALAAYQKAIDINPQHANAWHNMGSTLYIINRYEEALAAYQKAIDFGPQHPNAWCNLGSAFNALNRDEEALATFQKAIDLDPQHPNSWCNLGSAYNALNRYEKALAAYQKAIDLDPQDVNAWVGKGNTFYKLNQYEEALASFQKAIDVDPQHAAPWDGKGNTLHVLERYEEALPAYQMAIDLDPQFAYAWYNMGLILRYLNQYEEALTAYQKAIEIDPHLAHAWYGLAQTLLTLGRVTRSRRAIQRGLKLAGGNKMSGWLDEILYLLKAHDMPLLFLETMFSDAHHASGGGSTEATPLFQRLVTLKSWLPIDPSRAQKTWQRADWQETYRDWQAQLDDIMGLMAAVEVWAGADDYGWAMGFLAKCFGHDARALECWSPLAANSAFPNRLPLLVWLHEAAFDCYDESGPLWSEALAEAETWLATPDCSPENCFAAALIFRSEENEDGLAHIASRTSDPLTLALIALAFFKIAQDEDCPDPQPLLAQVRALYQQALKADEAAPPHRRLNLTPDYSLIDSPNPGRLTKALIQKASLMKLTDLEDWLYFCSTEKPDDQPSAEGQSSDETVEENTLTLFRRQYGQPDDQALVNQWQQKRLQALGLEYWWQKLAQTRNRSENIQTIYDDLIEALAHSLNVPQWLKELDNESSYLRPLAVKAAKKITEAFNFKTWLEDLKKQNTIEASNLSLMIEHKLMPHLGLEGAHWWPDLNTDVDLNQMQREFLYRALNERLQEKLDVQSWAQGLCETAPCQEEIELAVILRDLSQIPATELDLQPLAQWCRQVWPLLREPGDMSSKARDLRDLTISSAGPLAWLYDWWTNEQEPLNQRWRTPLKERLAPGGDLGGWFRTWQNNLTRQSELATAWQDFQARTSQADPEGLINHPGAGLVKLSPALQLWLNIFRRHCQSINLENLEKYLKKEGGLPTEAFILKGSDLMAHLSCAIKNDTQGSRSPLLVQYFLVQGQLTPSQAMAAFIFLEAKKMGRANKVIKDTAMDTIKFTAAVLATKIISGFSLAKEMYENFDFICGCLTTIVTSLAVDGTAVAVIDGLITKASQDQNMALLDFYQQWVTLGDDF